VNLAATTVCEEAPSRGRVKPSATLPSFFRLASLLGTTTWVVGRIHTGGDPEALMARWIDAVLRILRVEIRVEGQIYPEPQLWIANHVSWLDPLVLMALRPMGALAKREVSTYPLIGRASMKAGLAFVDRDDPTSRAAALARLAAELRQGRNMLLFPEGTTTRGDRLAPLQEGGLRAAYRCRTLVQAVRISSQDAAHPWIGDDELLPHAMNLLRVAGTRVSVHAGALMDPWQFPTEDGWIQAIRRELAP
jgi:lyso-ornithine lipid O-acyltransferase